MKKQVSQSQIYAQNTNQETLKKQASYSSTSGALSSSRVTLSKKRNSIENSNNASKATSLTRPGTSKKHTKKHPDLLFKLSLETERDEQQLKKKVRGESVGKQKAGAPAASTVPTEPPSQRQSNSSTPIYMMGVQGQNQNRAKRQTMQPELYISNQSKNHSITSLCSTCNLDVNQSCVCNQNIQPSNTTDVTRKAADFLVPQELRQSAKQLYQQVQKQGKQKQSLQLTKDDFFNLVFRSTTGSNLSTTAPDSKNLTKHSRKLSNSSSTNAIFQEPNNQGEPKRRTSLSSNLNKYANKRAPKATAQQSSDLIEMLDNPSIAQQQFTKMQQTIREQSGKRRKKEAGLSHSISSVKVLEKQKASTSARQRLKQNTSHSNITSQFSSIQKEGKTARVRKQSAQGRKEEVKLFSPEVSLEVSPPTKDNNSNLNTMVNMLQNFQTLDTKSQKQILKILSTANTSNAQLDFYGVKNPPPSSPRYNGTAEDDQAQVLVKKKSAKDFDRGYGELNEKVPTVEGVGPVVNRQDESMEKLHMVGGRQAETMEMSRSEASSVPPTGGKKKKKAPSNANANSFRQHKSNSIQGKPSERDLDKIMVSKGGNAGPVNPRSFYDEPTLSEMETIKSTGSKQQNDVKIFDTKKQPQRNDKKYKLKTAPTSPRLSQRADGYPKKQHSIEAADRSLQRQSVQLRQNLMPAPPKKAVNLGKRSSSETGAPVEEPKIQKPTPTFIPRNVVTKYAFATRVGYIPNNPAKVNQDSYILCPNIHQAQNEQKAYPLHMFGVCDGHGQNGRDVSQFIKDKVPRMVQEQLQNLAAFMPLPMSSYREMFDQVFLTVDRQLAEQTFDVQLSGSTVVIVFFDGTRLVCANAGDSRAIKTAIFKQTGDETWQIRSAPLNVDHKLEIPEEAQRIHAAGGRIEAFKDPDNEDEWVGPQRVWLPDEEYPGLAMSRSLGDRIAHSVGVSSVPEVKEFLIDVDDKFVVIASDGLWEFMENEEVSRIVGPYYDDNQPEAAANAVRKAAHTRWIEEEEVIDDITVVIVFLEPRMAYMSNHQEQPENYSSQ